MLAASRQVWSVFKCFVCFLMRWCEIAQWWQSRELVSTVSVPGPAPLSSRAQTPSTAGVHHYSRVGGAAQGVGSARMARVITSLKHRRARSVLRSNSPALTRALRTVVFCDSAVTLTFPFRLVGSLSEPERLAGVRRERGGRHDDHFPDIADGPFWEPDDVRPEGERGQNPHHKRKQEGSECFCIAVCLKQSFGSARDSKSTTIFCPE